MTQHAWRSWSRPFACEWGQSPLKSSWYDFDAHYQWIASYKRLPKAWEAKVGLQDDAPKVPDEKPKRWQYYPSGGHAPAFVSEIAPEAESGPWVVICSPTGELEYRSISGNMATKFEVISGGWKFINGWLVREVKD